MEITGRITKDAVVNQLKDERQVINFTVAINDYYKPKNSLEGKRKTTFINCSYWLTSKIAQRLTKGTLVELSGRIGVNAYVDLQGEARATLTFHVNSIKIHGFGKSASETSVPTYNEVRNSLAASRITEPADDLPF
ncbi:single-stranded DNA-binding protein [Segetibacter koreensis]|uniref:single-stranded DNA-binding protein n=1 Tax=Segetibacter koreensis TaxID=398037 RepID=UPI0003683509|nr:single-stranded DNA-binding protein [Segetibacter koreensis]